MKRLFRELILDGGYHNWITVPYIEAVADSAPSDLPWKAPLVAMKVIYARRLIGFRQLDGRLYRFGTAVAEETVL